MKKLRWITLVTCCAVILLSISAFTKKQTTNEPPTPKANIMVSGGGTTEEFGELSTFSFSAVRQSSGKTTGHILLNFRAADGTLWIDVDCLRLLGDNKATLSGIITKVRIGKKASEEFPAPPFVYVGGRVSFTVQDNGEGALEPDRVSDVGVIDLDIPASCDDVMDTYLPLSGNVQISQ